MKPPVFLVHGWGYDASIWDDLAARLDDRTVFRAEAGYFGAVPHWPSVPPGTMLVGHSAGTLALLEHRPAGCDVLVSINGFSRFSAAEPSANDGFPGVSGRVLARMERALMHDPDETVGAFRRRCGTSGDPGAADRARLAAGLSRLRAGDARDAAAEGALTLHALAATDDPIVTPEHTRACFPAASLHWTDGGHALPTTRPDWCAHMIGMLG